MSENKPPQESESQITTAPTRMPSLRYLLNCSRQSLYDLELAALNRSSNCLQVAKTEWQEAVAQREIAGVARWLIENRDALLQMTSRTVDVRPLEELPLLPAPRPQRPAHAR
jgi:hypothetical protein